jgi:preprotein translocase SecE subunit
VIIELKKTNWPTRNELTKYVVVVVATIFVVAVYLYLLDKAGQFLSTRLFNIHLK